MDFFAQQLLDLVRVARNVFEILGQKVHRASVQSIQRDAGTFVSQRGEHQHRSRAALHDMTHGRNAVHHRHFVVHGNDIWLEGQRQINCFLAIGCGTHNLDVRI